MSIPPFVSPSIAEMDKRLAQARKNGMKGIGIFVPNSADISSEDVASDFCKLESLFDQGKLINTTSESL